MKRLFVLISALFLAAMPVLAQYDIVPLGTPYVANTLEPAVVPAHPARAVEPLVIRLDSVDCTTFVEYVSASVLGGIREASPNDSTLLHYVEALRYRGGKRGNYASRKHYFTEWISDNAAQGFMSDVTDSCVGVVRTKKTINFMSTHPQSYPQLASCPLLVEQIREVESALSQAELCYIPCADIARNYTNLRNGDIVAFVTRIAGLDVQHVGFVWREGSANESPRLLHASSAKGCVVVSDVALADYASRLKNCIGIKVIRLNVLK